MESRRCNEKQTFRLVALGCVCKCFANKAGPGCPHDVGLREVSMLAFCKHYSVRKALGGAVSFLPVMESRRRMRLPHGQGPGIILEMSPVR